MPPVPGVDSGVDSVGGGVGTPEPAVRGKRLKLILWSSFVMAGVLEMLVFVVVDPLTLSWFGMAPLGWTANAVYSVTFLIFWLVISLSGVFTWLLEGPGPAVER